MIFVRRNRDIENERAEILRREVRMAIAQAERGEFSTLTVDEIAERVLREEA